jgi:hypothetical protein
MNATRPALIMKIACTCGVLLLATAAPAAEVSPVRPNRPVAAKAPVPDSGQLEKDLQQLPWKQFRSVIESIPKMKAEVEAYGSIGWQYVEARYKTYPWKKSIDKLDASQKRQLADLIRKAGRR